jgi:hypothetical protein
MKVTGLEVVSENTNVFTLSMAKVSSKDKYLLKGHAGLDADDIVRKFYGFGNQTKPRFFTASIVKRDVVLRIQLNPNYAINESFSDIRDELYRSISLNRTGVLDLLFTAGGGISAKLTGFIKKFEVPLSSEVPELQMTIQCIDPVLRGINPIILNAADLGESSPIIIGDNVSTAPHGLSFAVEFLEPWSWFVMQDKFSFAEWSFQVVPTDGFLTGDVLHVVTDYGKTNVYVDRDGSIIPLMDKVSPGSMWPLIFPKNNTFFIPDINRMQWVHLTYYPAYWGI